jgi:hypothetical protein
VSGADEVDFDDKHELFADDPSRVKIMLYAKISTIFLPVNTTDDDMYKYKYAVEQNFHHDS